MEHENDFEKFIDEIAEAAENMQKEVCDLRNVRYPLENLFEDIKLMSEFFSSRLALAERCLLDGLKVEDYRKLLIKSGM